LVFFINIFDQQFLGSLPMLNRTQMMSLQIQRLPNFDVVLTFQFDSVYWKFCLGSNIQTYLWGWYNKVVCICHPLLLQPIPPLLSQVPKLRIY
jgi:hypothetical protein